VTLIDPVAAPFTATAELSASKSYDPTSLTVINESSSDTVAIKHFDEPSPATVRASTEVSDLHHVASLEVPPTRTSADLLSSAIDPPTTVTDVPPVVTRFVNVVLVRWAPSKVWALLKLTIRSAAVLTADMPVAWPAAHRPAVELDDSHAVASAWLPPT
jgi:hypothetical protein